MNIHQSRCDLPEHVEGNWCVVDKRAAFSGCADLATDHRAHFVVEVFALKKFLKFVCPDIELCFGDAFFVFVPKHFGVSTIAEKQSHSAEHNGLSCPGLTGNHVESRSRLQFQVLNKGVIFYGEKTKHREAI